MSKRPLCMGCLLFVVAIAICLLIMKDSPPDYSDWEGKHVFVTGRVTSIEELMSIQGPVTVLYLKQIPVANTEPDFPQGTMMCYLSQKEKRPRVGSAVELSGTIRCFEHATNEGQFDQAKYYQILDISCKLKNATIQKESVTYHKRKETLYQLKLYFDYVLDNCFPEQEASIMKTMLLGQKGLLDQEVKGLYQRNGIAHILAISGVKTPYLVSPITAESGLKWAFVSSTYC